MKESWDFVGNAWAVDMLRQHVARGAPRHAYLFAGPPGVGRRTLALRLAQSLNCTQPIQPGVPCGGCTECKQIEEMKHPDVTPVQAESEGGTLKVDQVREARRRLGLKPFQSKYRVVLFLRFQEANDAASNALLKILEEAPSYAVLILTADSREELLPTIVSRCEVLRLQPAPVEAVESFLRERGATEDTARLLAHISGGRPGLALKLLQEPERLAYRDEKLSDLRSLLPATRAQRFSYADRLSKDRSAMRGVLTLWLSFWRDVLWRASGADTQPDNIDRLADIDSLAERVGLPGARRIVSDLEKALGRLDANVNARLLAEVLLLDWPR